MKSCKISFLLAIALTLNIFSYAQQGSVRPPMDTSRKSVPVNGTKAYKDLITAKAVSDNGLFTVHKVEEKYYFEIPDTLFEREILVINRISKSAAANRIGGSLGYGGDQIAQHVIKFEKGPNNKVFIRNISYAEYAKDSASSMFSSFSNSNIQPISASFDIKAFGKDSSGAIIDVTDIVNADNELLHFTQGQKSNLRIGAIQPDKSYTVALKSYPINVEIKTVKTYLKAPAPGAQGGAASSGGFLTYELNSSLILLPKQPMRQRRFDNRVGYFTTEYVDFDANPQGVENIVLAKRWKLEPKEEDVQNYLKGQLVEPKKPIIYYIDPATPKKWVPYLIQGVNDWQKAFEKAGFKNAIIGRVAPTKDEDSTWSLYDARNSAIVYKASDVPNASGPSIADPRSGEIIETHINWYHNVMQLAHHWYMIQTAATDPKARKMILDDELMGRLIRFVSSHEVGHTLGLRHNFGSSSTVPVESLRNKEWVSKNGHTPSIMDYARFNYVAQPEDGLSGEELIARIGDYDKWAIEWGYRWLPEFESEAAEETHLNKWVIENLKDKRKWWGDGESNIDDPRNQTEDLSDNAVKASQYGIANLKRILPNLISWTKEDNKGYSNLAEMYAELYGQFGRYMGHVSRIIGGVNLTPKKVEEPGVVYNYVSKEKQKEAVDFINQQLFTTPAWLVNYEILNRTGSNPLTIVGGLQDGILSRLLNTRVFNKLIEQEAALGTSAYTADNLLADLRKGIWKELPGHKAIDLYSRNLQKSYISLIGNLLVPPPVTEGSNTRTATSGLSIDKSDIKSILREHLQKLRTEIKSAVVLTSDKMTKSHLNDIVFRIERILDPK